MESERLKSESATSDAATSESAAPDTAPDGQATGPSGSGDRRSAPGSPPAGEPRTGETPRTEASNGRAVTTESPTSKPAAATQPTRAELTSEERVSTTYDIDTGGRAPALEARDVSVHYGTKRAVNDISLVVPANQVVALIGPSGCGKSTLLRCFNRMNDLVSEARVDGEVLFHGENLYHPEVDPVEVRRRIGMVFQKPNPFPKSIYDNVAFGPRVNGFGGDLDALVETSLRQAALWDEVHDRLGDLAYNLSGGQQQRLCIARTLAVKPEIVLMDEPASALDPIATQRIEDLIYELKQEYTIVIVTHNMQQAARISDYTAFLYMGELIEYGPTDAIFTSPREERTEAYVTGRFG